MLLLPVAVTLLAACDQAVEIPKGEDLDMRISVGETKRSLRVHVSTDVVEGAPVRLIMAFHGSGDTGWRMQLGAGLDEASVGTATVLVYPQGLAGGWDESCDCDETDDIDFVEAMLDSLGNRWDLDANRTYAVGFSLGGMFVHRIGCDLSDRFAAIAAVSASMSRSLSDRCQPARPVSTAILHGTEDPIIPWGNGDGGSLGPLSAEEAAEFWAHQSDCDTDPAIEVQELGDGKAVRTHEYLGCYQARRVLLYELVGYGHTWPRGPFEAGESIVEFFGGDGS